MQQRGLTALVVVCLLSALAAPAVAAAPSSSTEQLLDTGDAVDADATVARNATPDFSTSDAPGAATGGTTAAGASAASTAAATTAGDDIHLTTTLALTPDRPGSVAVTLRFGLPDRVTAVEATIASEAEAVTTDGFAAAGGDTYEWDGETTAPTIRYRLPANRTTTSARLGHRRLDANVGGATAPAAADRGYLFADPGPWALVAVPGTGVSWRYRGETVGLSREATTGGPGAVGERVAFLGEHAVRERTANGQTFRLVVPAESADSMAASPERLLDSLSSASDSLRVGDRDESVFVVAAPTGVDWAVAGLQTGDADAWVRADEPLADARSAWLHEYVHTRQSFEPTAETRWLIEGSADYYAARLALQQGLIDFPAFADHLERGAAAPYGDDVLADPNTWTTATPYRKGALVAGDTDRRIRLASDGAATFETVFARLNAESDPVSGDRFLAIVADAGDESVADETARVVRTDAAPAMWSAADHEAAFGTPVARILVDAPARLTVGGPYRNGSLDSPVRIALGETLTVPVSLSNDGGADGSYRVALAANDRTVAVANGTLAAGENATVPLSWTPNESGTYALTVRGHTYEAFVEEPPTPTVAGVSLNRTTVAAGDAVLVTAAVVADGRVPADGDLAVRVDGRTVATERARVAPDAAATLRVPIRIGEPGTYTVSVGDASASLTVESAAAATDPDGGATDGPGDSGVSTPGFGVGAAAAALAIAGSLAALAGPRSKGDWGPSSAVAASPEPSAAPASSSPSQAVSPFFMLSTTASVVPSKEAMSRAAWTLDSPCGHTVTMRSLPDSDATRVGSWLNGMFSEPGMWPRAYAPGERMSTTRTSAPSARSRSTSSGVISPSMLVGCRRPVKSAPPSATPARDHRSGALRLQQPLLAGEQDPLQGRVVRRRRADHVDYLLDGDGPRDEVLVVVQLLADWLQSLREDEPAGVAQQPGRALYLSQQREGVGREAGLLA